MARPRKAGLSYFPLDVDILEADYRITDLYDRYGPRGFTVYITLLCMIYREGYYLEIPMQSLERQLGRVLGNRWFDKRILPEVIGFCGELGLFDKGLLQQGVLTSAGIQRRYQEATKRNKTQIRKYRLLEENPPKAGESTPEKNVSESETPVFDAETPVSVAETAVSATNCVQRKEKERKQNKSKENSLPGGREKETPPVKSGDLPAPAAERKGQNPSYQLYGRFRNVKLTPNEYQALAVETGDAESLIEKLSAHMAATGKQYQNHFARLLQWDMEDRGKGKAKRKTSGFGGPSFDLEAFGKQGFELADGQFSPSYDIREFEKGGFDLPDLGEDDDDGEGSEE